MGVDPTTASAVYYQGVSSRHAGIVVIATSGNHHVASRIFGMQIAERHQVSTEYTDIAMIPALATCPHTQSRAPVGERALLHNYMKRESI